MPINPYEAALAQLTSENPYEQTLIEQAKQESSALSLSLKKAGTAQPDRRAKVLQLSERFKLPSDFVERNFDELSRRGDIEETQQLTAQSPKLREWLKGADNAAVSKDDVQNLTVIDRLLDVARSLPEGVTSGIGIGVTGAGSLLDIARRRLVPHLPGGWLIEQLPDAVNPWELAPPGLRRLGSEISENAKFYAPAPERQNLATDITSGIGQLIPQVGLALVTGGASSSASLFTMITQGAGIMAERADHAGKTGTLSGDVSTVLGAGVTAATERWGLGMLLNRVPPKIKNAALRWIADVGIAGGIEGSQEAAEGLLHNAVTRLALDPNQELLAGLSREALAAGGAGAVARVLLQAVVPGRARKLQQAEQAQQNPAFSQALGKAVTDSKLFARLPAKLREFMEKAAPGATFGLPLDSFTQYFQDKGMDPAAEAAKLTGNSQAYAHAIDAGTDLQVPVANFATDIAAGEHGAFFENEFRSGPDEFNAREAEAWIKEQSAAPDTEGAPSEAASALDASTQKIIEDLTGQLKGIYPDDYVATYAAYEADRYKNTAERAGVDPFELYQSRNLTISRPLPGILTDLPDYDTALDPLIDRLRSGELPTQEEIWGKSLLTFLRETGVKDDGGDLASREPDKDLKPFTKKLIQEKGLPLDKAREAAVEAGYLDAQASLSDFKELIDKELRGTAVFAQREGASEKEALRDTLDQLDTYLRDRGVDLKTASNADVKRLVRNAASIEGDAFDQPGARRIEDELQTSVRIPDSVPVVKIASTESFAGMEGGDFRDRAFSQVEDLAAHEPVTNQHTGWSVGFSKDKGVKKSANFVNRPERLVAFENLPELIRQGTYLRNEANRDNPKQGFPYDHLYTPFTWNGQQYIAKMALRKGRADKGTDKTFYSLHALEVSRPGRLSSDHTSDLSDGSLEAAGYPLDGGSTVTTAELFAFVNEARQQSALFQEEGYQLEKRGSFSFRVLDKSGKVIWRGVDSKEGRRLAEAQGGTFGSLIELLPLMNLTTFIHEMSHSHLEVVGDVVEMLAAKDPETLTDTQRRLVEDYGKILKFMGVASRLEIGREQHELWARANELYVAEGKAPSPELRPVFHRFKAWLKQAYKNLTELRVTLNDDIRGVMDRLAASDEQIERAREDVRMQSMLDDFATAQALGLSKQEHDLHKEKIAAARQAQEEALEAEYLDENTRYQSARYEVLRAEVRAEVAKEIHGQRAYIALALLQKGTLPDGSALSDGQREWIARELGLPADFKSVKLDAAALDEKYGKASRKKGEGSRLMNRLLELGVYRRKDGLDPDKVAEVFGYTSGDEMVKALAETRPMNEFIDALTKDQMDERHGNMLTDGTAAEKARDAVLTIGQPEIVEAEIRALAKAEREAAPAINLGKTRERQAQRETRTAGMREVRAGLPSVALARSVAEARIAEKRVRDLTPGLYSAAAQRESMKAVEAVNAGNFAAAREAKQKQLINLEMYRAAKAALAEAQKIVEYKRSFDNLDKRKKIGKAGADYLEQIDALWERFGFSRLSNKAIDRKHSLAEWITRQQEKGIPIELPAALLNESRRQNYREMTMEELRGLRDAVRQIEHTALFKNKLLKAKTQREFDEIKAEILARIDAEVPRGTRDLRTRENAGTVHALAGWARSFSAMHRKMSSMCFELDGLQMGGPMWENFERPKNESGNAEVQMRQDAVERIDPLLAPALAQGKMGGKGDYFPSVGMSFNREERISIAFNVGNASNLQRLLDGEEVDGKGWTREQIDPILDTLTKADWDVVRGVWKFFESYRPQISALEKGTVGVEPEWIEPTPVQTKFGEIPGGYYPVRFDPARSAKAEAYASAEDAKAMQRAAHTSATTRRSFTKSRADEVHGRPLLYSFAGLYQGTAEIIHDLAWREWLIDANKIISDAGIDKAIRTRFGPEGVNVFKSGIQDIARGDVPAVTAFEKALNHFRKAGTVAALGWKTVTALKQFGGFGVAAVRIGKGWTVRAMLKAMGSPIETMHFVNADPFMRDRGLTMQRDIHNIRDQVAGKTARQQALEASYFILTQATQRTVDTVAYVAQYNKAMAESTKGRTPEEHEARARAMGQQAVLDTQGGGQVKDLAQIQRGHPALKLFTMFYHGFAAQYQITVERGKQAGRVFWSDASAITKGAEALSLSVDYLLIYGLQAAISVGIARILLGDDDEPLSEALKREGLESIMGLMVGVREGVGVVEKLFDMQKYNRDYSGPAGLRALSVLENTAEQINQGEWDRALRSTLVNAAGALKGLPSSQVNATLDGIVAIWEGKTQNPAAPLVGAPKE